MRASEEDALICDFAEYYRIYNIDEIDINKAAILACGLPAESRSVRKITGQKMDTDLIVRAGILDTVRSIEYLLYKKYAKGHIEKPKSIVRTLYGETEKKENGIQGFVTADEFEAARKRALEGTKNGE